MTERPYYDQSSLAMGPQAISPLQQVNFAQPTHPWPPKHGHPKNTPPAIVYAPSHRSHQPHYTPPAMFHHPPQTGPNGTIYSHSAPVPGQYPPAYTTPYPTSSQAFREYMSSRERKAFWVQSNPPTESEFHSPSLLPSVIDELVPSSPPSDADSSDSTPPKMVLRYSDGRPDVPIPIPVPTHVMGKQGSKVYRNSPQTSASRITRVKLGSSGESPVSNPSSRRDHESSLPIPWGATNAFGETTPTVTTPLAEELSSSQVTAGLFSIPSTTPNLDFDDSKPKSRPVKDSVVGRTSVLSISRPASVSSERDTDNSSLSGGTRGRKGSTSNFPPLPSVDTPQSPIAEPPLSEAAAKVQASVGTSPLITSSEIFSPTLPPSVKETQDSTGYISPVIDSTVGNPGAFTNVIDDLRPSDIAQDPQAVAPYIIEPIAESIKEFEPVDHANNTAEFSEAVHGNDNVISHDPFADLITSRMTQPVLDMLQYDNLGLSTTSPTPLIDAYRPEFTDNIRQGSAETHSHSPIVMHLPSFDDVIASIPIHHAPSMSSLKNGNIGNPIQTHEVLPLLSRPAKRSKHIPSSYFKTCPHDLVSIFPPVYSTSQSTSSDGNANSWLPHPHPKLQMLHTLGWLEYHLPDGTVYYVHTANRVTTEINLRSEIMLTGVERFLADYSKDQSDNALEETLASGGEIWLRDVGSAKNGLVLERWWVDHRLRTVVIGGEDEHARKGSGKGKGGAVFSEEDQLDTEYRYWSFMEAHPAHNSLPAEAKMRAMEVLRWARMERLFPSHCAIPTLFTQEESQELMTLIRSFDDDLDDHGIQTRIVSRVFLEVAHWRQTYFRPNKLLPTNVGSNQSRHSIAPRQLFKWVIVDFFLSCLFLCIPYILFERTRLSARIVDEESGLHYTTFTLVVGACTCFVVRPCTSPTWQTDLPCPRKAAVVLSAFLTFLFLPGLGSFSRTTGMVAILFAAFLMVATVVAIFGHKTVLKRLISHVGD